MESSAKTLFADTAEDSIAIGVAVRRFLDATWFCLAFNERGAVVRPLLIAVNGFRFPDTIVKFPNVRDVAVGELVELNAIVVFA